MKNCPNCKARIGETSTICWKCNYDLEEERVIISNEIHDLNHNAELYHTIVKERQLPLAIEINGTSVSPYAEAVPRFGAWIIDSILVVIVAVIVNTFVTLILEPKPIIISFLSYVIYHSCYLYSSGQTVGKKLFRIKVIKVDGQPISVNLSIVRSIASFISLQLSIITAIIFILDKRGQIFQDYVANTVVIDISYEKQLLEVIENKSLEESLEVLL